MPILTQQTNCNPLNLTLPYPTLLPYPTILPYPILNYLALYLILYLIPILYIYIYTYYVPCFTLPYHRFTPTLPFPLFTPTLTLLIIPYTLFSITLKPLDRFTSNFQVTLSSTQKTIWSPLHYGHAWT